MLCYCLPIKDLAFGVGRMKRFGLFAALAFVALPAPAAAQMTDKDSFIEAVRSRDNNKALELLESRGPSVVDARNRQGETPLLVAIDNRDSTWVRFLLQNDANPDLAGRSGEVPLIAAVRIGFTDAVDGLLAARANVDATNRMGETALIVAVQQRRAPLVRKLLARGADPDIADAAAGYSARDYAKRDTRSREILSMIEAAEKEAEAKPVEMDDFKL